VHFDVLIRAKRLRATDSTSATPIPMLTARGTISDRVAGLDSGADDHLVKPFAPAAFVARIRIGRMDDGGGRSLQLQLKATCGVWERQSAARPSMRPRLPYALLLYAPRSITKGGNTQNHPQPVQWPDEGGVEDPRVTYVPLSYSRRCGAGAQRPKGALGDPQKVL